MSKPAEEKSYSAPGRVCLYGEHQDYLKLVVIPAAVDLRTTITLQKNQSNKIKIKSHELEKTHEFTVTRDLPLAFNDFDYFRAIIKVLFEEEIINAIPGFDISISSNIPIGSGLSSSAALLVAWLTALDDQLDLNLTKLEIADIAFKAENQVLGVNCGIMDQYSSSLGGIFSLDCNGPPYEIKSFTSNFDSIIIGDSCIRRSANKPLTILKNQINKGFGKIKQQSDLKLATLTVDELESFKSILTEDEFRRLFGVIIIRNITLQAKNELSKKNQDIELLGELLTKQQDMLRDYLEVSIPMLDNLVKESIKAGALGGKLTGAGLGGCMIALAPGKEEKITKAINAAGGKATICKIDYDGAK